MHEHASRHDPSLWDDLPAHARLEFFRQLAQSDAAELFTRLDSADQAELLRMLAPSEQRLWFRMLAPDDAADVVQAMPPTERDTVLHLLEDPARREVTALLAYAEDAAGGLMSPRFARLRPDMTADEAFRYLQRQTKQSLETIYYAYVLDHQQHLLGVVSFRELFTAPVEKPLREVMHTQVVSVSETTDEEQVARLMSRYSLNAIPVLDANGAMKGIVTIDDVIDVVQDAATEDIHKLGGMEALETPYLRTSLAAMIEKRAGWLAVLFVGEMLTASAMAHYEEEIAQAVVLALFVPLIISSGGNSGSQATTLMIRAMALGEVELRDWWRIIRRDAVVGLALGLILAVIGLLRIVLWEAAFHTYGEHYLAIAWTVALSLVGVVGWGTLSGAMLPFIIRKFGFDPASASAPFVATMVDVSGLVIYFSIARVLLSGSLL